MCKAIIGEEPSSLHGDDLWRKYLQKVPYVSKYEQADEGSFINSICRINTTSKLQYREPDSSDFAAGDPEYEIYVNLNSL